MSISQAVSSRLGSSCLVSSGLPPDAPLPTRFRQPAAVEDHGIRIIMSWLIVTACFCMTASALNSLAILDSRHCNTLLLTSSSSPFILSPWASLHRFGPTSELPTRRCNHSVHLQRTAKRAFSQSQPSSDLLFPISANRTSHASR